MNNVLYIILGWLLGILSPGIITHISNHYRKEKIKEIMISDLKDLKMRLVLLPYKVKSDYGIVDKESILWLKKQTNDWEDIPSKSEFKEKFEKLENESSIENFVNLSNSLSRRDRPAFNFKKMTTTIIDSNLISAEILDNIFISKILEIKFQINAFNEEVDKVGELLKMTFDSSITTENHDILSLQIEKTNLVISDKAIYIIEKINSIIN